MNRNLVGLALFGALAVTTARSAHADMGSTPCPTSLTSITSDTANRSLSQVVNVVNRRVISSLTITPRDFVPSRRLAYGCGGGYSLTGAAEPAQQDAALGLGPDDAATTPETVYNSAWTGGAHTRIKKTDASGEFSGNIDSVVVGYDRRLTSDLILGVVVGYDSLDILTHYNQGSVEGDSIGVAPYIGYAITDWLTVDATLGYAWVNYDMTRDVTVTGSTNGGRVFGGANLTARQNFGDVKLWTSVGYQRLKEERDGYTESDNTVVKDETVDRGQAHATVGGGYDFVTDFGVISPNAFARFEYDLPKGSAVQLTNSLSSSNDRTGIVLGLGTDVALKSNVSFGVSGTMETARENTDAYSVLANVRYAF